MHFNIRPLPPTATEPSPKPGADTRATLFMDALRARVAAQDEQQRQPPPPPAPARKKRQKA